MLSLAGNLVWLLCGGLISCLSWAVAGLLWCVTIVGIPIGAQCFKFAQLSLSPFGKDVSYEGGAVSFLVNVIWFFVSGIELALIHFILGIILCVTIAGIPFGMQFFKFAKLSLAPFGAQVIKKFDLVLKPAPRGPVFAWNEIVLLYFLAKFQMIIDSLHQTAYNKNQELHKAFFVLFCCENSVFIVRSIK